MEDLKLTINKDYAKRFQKNKEREELFRCGYLFSTFH